MKETIIYPLRIPKEIMFMVEARSREEYEDKAIVLRKMLYEAIEHYLLRCCEKGRISIGKVAEILKKSIYDVMEDAKERGIKLGATEKQEQVVMLTAKNIKISQEELRPLEHLK